MCRTVNSGGKGFHLDKWSLLGYNAVFNYDTLKQFCRFLTMVHYLVCTVYCSKNKFKSFRLHTKWFRGTYSDGSDTDYQPLATLHLLKYHYIITRNRHWVLWFGFLFLSSLHFFVSIPIISSLYTFCY